MHEAHDYSEYYGDAALRAWRDLCAVDKADNVLDLWSMVGQPAPKVIDIGCGDGAIVEELARRGFGDSFAGFEVSASGVACAQVRRYAKPAAFSLFDGRHLPVPDMSFDLAVMSHVLEHVESPRTLLREAARVAAWVYVEVPLELHSRTPRDYHASSVGHINLFNVRLVRHLMQSSGLRVIGQRVTCPDRRVFAYRHSALGGLARWLSKSALLRMAPVLAVQLFTYHGSLIARSTLCPELL